MPKREPSAISKQTESKRTDLGARWSVQERAEINSLADMKGVGPTQIIRMAVKRYLLDHKREEERNSKMESQS